MRFTVKICGLSRPSDFETCADAGADLVGLVYYEPSPRHLTFAQMADLARMLGWSGRSDACPLRVGVFVNPSHDDVLRAIEAGCLHYVQIHGSRLDEGLAAAKSAGVHVIHPVSIAQSVSHEQFRCPVDAAFVLADTALPGQHGGTGQTFDHSLLMPHLGAHRILLAGGLTPENIAEAVRELPGLAGCDVSSGVESSRGVKDPQKIRHFIAQARLGASAASREAAPVPSGRANL